PQVPMGRSYERSDLFGGDEAPAKSRSSILIRNAAGRRVSRGQKFALSAGQASGWIAKNQAKVIAEYPDGTAAAFVTKFGKGSVLTIMPDAAEAAARFPALTRDILDLALAAAGRPALLDVTGSNENVETSVRHSDDGVYFSFVNENDRNVTLRVGPGSERNECFNMSASVPLPVSLVGGRLTLQLGPHRAGIWECKLSP
ncbi:MAG: hypothetical protein ABI539_00485, partial [Acidobacteriota bacterium]